MTLGGWLRHYAGRIQSNREWADGERLRDLRNGQTGCRFPLHLQDAAANMLKVAQEQGYVAYRSPSVCALESQV